MLCITSKNFLLIAAFMAFQAEATLFKKCDLSRPESLNIKSFDRCTQTQLDNFYRSLSAGSSIPEGVFDGKVQIAKPGKQEKFKIVKTLRNIVPNLLVNEPLEFFLERLWGGKIFYRETPNKAVLFNRIGSSREMFPAHVYYGRSLFDSSKLSIIIDYSHNQDIEGYRPSVDWVVNEEGLTIRDEVRKVKSGLYLGRAYVKGKFLLNFVLELER